MKISQIMFEYLRFSLMKTQISNPLKSLEDQTLKGLYVLSKKHDLGHLVAYGLEQNQAFNNSTITNKFLYERDMALFRHEQINYELDCVCKTLEDAEIYHIPLKGAVIRKYYPEEWMRNSCDIDILVKEEDLDKALFTLSKKLEYTYGKKGDHDVLLNAPSGVHIELHYQLITPKTKKQEIPVLKRVWENTKPLEDSIYCRKMNDEYFYCYHISHIAKHLKWGGCGVRSVIDTWVLNNNISFDKEKRNSLLNEAGLLKVANAIENLAKCWMENKPLSQDLQLLSSYILSGGVYGTLENKVAISQSKKGGCSYLFSRVFMPYGELKYKYPNLQKYPILYPFYTVKRWFSLLKKDKRAVATKELNHSVKINSQTQDQISNMLNSLDL